MEKPKTMQITPVKGQEPILIEVTEIEGGSSLVPAGRPPLNFDEMLKKDPAFL